MGVLNEHCPTRELLDLVADRWTVLVVLLLSERPHRFADLRRRTTGISQRMLTVTLRRLERDGLVRRSVQPTKPPQVTYALSELGGSLTELVGSMRRWAEDQATDVMEARKRFDRRTRARLASPR
ncbi:MAG: helix-turn-helix transcriptional regulator [Clostridia bacterium]|nr:helix-turn-helix transcriptional regulator [Deltaproteobacteria bacterium]